MVSGSVLKSFFFAKIVFILVLILMKNRNVLPFSLYTAKEPHGNSRKMCYCFQYRPLTSVPANIILAEVATLKTNNRLYYILRNSRNRKTIIEYVKRDEILLYFGMQIPEGRWKNKGRSGNRKRTHILYWSNEQIHFDRCNELDFFYYIFKNFYYSSHTISIVY